MRKWLVLFALDIVFGFSVLVSGQVYPLMLWPGDGGGGSGSGQTGVSFFFYQPGAIQLVLGTTLVLAGLVGLLVSGLRPPTKRKKH
jgi:hypothetical protein